MKTKSQPSTLTPALTGTSVTELVALIDAQTRSLGAQLSALNTLSLPPLQLSEPGSAASLVQALTQQQIAAAVQALSASAAANVTAPAQTVEPLVVDVQAKVVADAAPGAAPSQEG